MNVYKSEKAKRRIHETYDSCLLFGALSLRRRMLKQPMELLM